MKKNIWFLSLPVCVLVLGIICASCDTSTDPGSKPDTWSPIGSLDQLNGTWKGTYKQTIPIQEVAGLLGQTGNNMGGMIEMLGDMKVTISAETTTTINASEKTRSGSATITLTFSDGSIKYSWELIKSTLVSYFPGAIPNDEKHSITMTQDIPEEPITDEEAAELLASGVQINQNGKKIKIPTSTILEESSEDIPPGLTGLIPKEIIMTRQ